jgi:hypothetical protein
MGPLRIVLFPKLIKAALLFFQLLLRRNSRLFLQSTVHPFVLAFLGGFARLYLFRVDPRLHPPDGEGG